MIKIYSGTNKIHLNRFLVFGLLFIYSGCASFTKDTLNLKNVVEGVDLTRWAIEVKDFAGRSIEEAKEIVNEDERDELRNYIERKYVFKSNVDGSSFKKMNKGKLFLKYTQVSSNYKSFANKLWFAGSVISLGLIPYHSDVLIYLEAHVYESGKLPKVYSSSVGYDFWFHLFLTPYLFNEHNEKYGRMALRHYLLDEILKNAKKDKIL